MIPARAVPARSLKSVMANRIMKFDERKLKETLQPYFDLARAGDWEHALRVVKWVKKLGQNRNDLYLLVAAAYIHDIGWSGISPKGKINLAEMLELETKANKNSSRLILEVLTNLQFTDSEIQTVIRFVAAADKRRSKLEGEAILVDADNLSKLCLEHLKEKYQPEDFLKLINLWKAELVNRIRTQKGKELFPKLLSELEQAVQLTEK
jgi:HD superfamily phosphodiesterase